MTVQGYPSWLLLASHRSSFDVNKPERTILGDIGISGDYFGACVVNFEGHTRHKMHLQNCYLGSVHREDDE